jgi:hypothetical protein
MKQPSVEQTTIGGSPIRFRGDAAIVSCDWRPIPSLDVMSLRAPKSIRFILPRP